MQVGHQVITFILTLKFDILPQGADQVPDVARPGGAVTG
jgi:hypothetical protein